MTSTTTRVPWLGAAMVLLAAAAIGCGDTPSSGVPPATKLADLTDAQQKTICDFINEQQGGYDKTVECADGSTEMNDASQAECVGFIPFVASQCPTLTSGDLETCAVGTGANQCAFATAPGCAKLRACVDSAS